ncbi:MAG: methyltransferase domain-containing protein [Acidimicrobiales bacterium]
MAAFATGEHRWIGNLGNLRNAVRQEVIARQLADHVGDGATVLDVGCGQGTQALRLAARGCRVTGVEPSADLRALASADADAARLELELVAGGIDDLDELLGERTFDAVCAHGLLMYLPDRTAAVRSLAGRVAPGGRLSITVRNGHALAFRPGLRGDWAGALAALEGPDYVNEIGVSARADRLSDVEADLDGVGLGVVAWYGVRVLNDAVPVDQQPPAVDDELGLLLEAEDRVGRLDPYRWMASQLHVVAARGEA